MRVLIQTVLLIVSALTLESCAHDLSGSYPFKAILNPADKGGLYELYWTFDNEAENISFAVRVQTTGWVGFGLSPKEPMATHDGVIGWVKNDGDVIFKDRFSPGRVPSVIDEQQDWVLEDGEEENGFTTLEFSRKYITCDDHDLPITTETANVQWSFSTSEDPSSEEPSYDNIYSGAVSLNLLGGLPSVAPDPDDLRQLDITVDNITIPDADTTYWCAAFQLPENIRTQTKHITKFGPVLTEGNEAYVHHLLIYQCNGLIDTHVGNSGECHEMAGEIQACRGGIIVALWVTGLEEFQYPDNVSYSLGEGSPQYLIMELHYDNPNLVSGIRDSSGIRLYYTGTRRKYNAGIIQLGYFVHPYMIVPPNAKNFTINSICIEECTSEYFPKDGIHVFANLLYAKSFGRGLTLQHLRYNSECNMYEELEPIDRNLRYDTNYPQALHLPSTKTILPGDIIQLQCIYDTENVDNVTIGGFSTRDEMCLSFPYYYPRIDMTFGLSLITDSDLNEYLQTLPPEAVNLLDQGKYVEGLNAVDWNADRVQGLEETLRKSSQLGFCNATKAAAHDSSVTDVTKFPEIGCSYIPPDTCTGYKPPTCCEKINGMEGSGVALVASVTLLLLLSVLAAIM